MMLTNYQRFLMYKKVYVCCPGNAMTAGPEAIHQLVADLNRLGQPAVVVYFPFDQSFSTVAAYQKYCAPVSKYVDEDGSLIIFPEIVTTFAFKVRHAKVSIWWMSVNNFTCQRYGYVWRDKLRYFKYFLKGLRPLTGVKALQNYMHFAQSYYAIDFLKKNGIDGQLLSDPIPVYTSKEYVASVGAKYALAKRDNIILYNPYKGASITKRLMQRYPHWVFKPLQGYNREQLADIFLSSKIYIDFGHHPGKDRLPREAAIHGCCVITGKNGSAGNSLDVNIPDGCKFSERDPNFEERVGLLVEDIFNNFNQHFVNFAPYRATISSEQKEFDLQIKGIFNL